MALAKSKSTVSNVIEYCSFVCSQLKEAARWIQSTQIFQMHLIKVRHCLFSNKISSGIEPAC
jgi:hypothetical protein